MSARRPKADKERTDSRVEEPAVRQPNRSRARRGVDCTQGTGLTAELDERERRYRRGRKPAGPAKLLTPPPPPAPSARRRGAVADDETIDDIPPTDPVYEDER